MQSQLFRHALVLGLVTAVGPFAIDMYLPVMPAIGRDLGASDTAVTQSLTAFFVPFAVCQLIYGAISDLFGRKPPLYFGIVLFLIASLGCAFAQDVNTLLFFRALQGIGAAAAIIIPRAIVRDMYSGLEEAKLMSLLMLVFSVAPLLAPLAGSLLSAAFGWRSVFWFVTTMATVGLLLTTFMVRETRVRAADQKQAVGDLFGAYRRLLTDGNFLGLVFTGGFGIGAFFVYLGNSSFVLIEHYGLSPMAYAFAFSINAFAFFASAQFNGALGKRFGLRAMVRPASLAFAGFMSVMAGLYFAGVDNLILLGVFMFIAYGFLGLFLPVTGVLALERYGDAAGAAASLMGTLHLVVGAGVIAISSAFADGSARPMVLGIWLCACLAAFFAQITLARRVPVAT